MLKGFCSEIFILIKIFLYRLLGHNPIYQYNFHYTCIYENCEVMEPQNCIKKVVLRNIFQEPSRKLKFEQGSP